MKFQVPQFIEVEDKIFGPLTFKQFIYSVGGVGIAVMLFLFLPKFLAVITALPVVLFAAALAFYKVNGKPFVYMVEAFAKYALTNKLYIWKKTENQPRVTSDGAKPLEQIYVPKLSESKLKELTWNLDIKNNQNPVTPNQDESGSGLPRTDL